MIKYFLIVATLLVSSSTTHFNVSHRAPAATKRLSTLQELKLRQEALLELLGRVQMEAILNHQMSLTIKKCINTANRSAECLHTRAEIIEPFKKVVRDSRMFLLGAYRDRVFGEQYFKLNTSMSNLSTYKETSWSKATAAEITAASGVINKWKREASEEAARMKNVGSKGAKHDRFVALKVRQKRVNLLDAYKEILSQIVILQPFSGTSVTTQNLTSALNTIISRSTKELESLKKAARIAENWMENPESCAETVDYQLSNPMAAGGMGIPTFAACINTPSSLASLMDYKGIVDGMEQENPAYKRVFKSVRSERNARSLGIGAMLLIPTLAVCVLAPPLVAVPVGAAAGGLSLLQSQVEYNRVKRREISRVINEKGTVDWEALKSARLSRNISVVLLPFFGGGRYVGPFLKNSSAGKYLLGTAKLKRMILKR